MKTIRALRIAIECEPTRSAWERGVKEYALELIEELENLPTCKEDLLNGADNWHAYSRGGCSLIYDTDIAERLCCPSELKKRKGGKLRPNSREEWLDVQTRALFQAAHMICRLARS